MTCESDRECLALKSKQACLSSFLLGDYARLRTGAGFGRGGSASFLLGGLPRGIGRFQGRDSDGLPGKISGSLPVNPAGFQEALRKSVLLLCSPLCSGSSEKPGTIPVP
jgi:hypothetical protein